MPVAVVPRQREMAHLLRLKPQTLTVQSAHRSMPQQHVQMTRAQQWTAMRKALRVAMQQSYTAMLLATKQRHTKSQVMWRCSTVLRRQLAASPRLAAQVAKQQARRYTTSRSRKVTIVAMTLCTPAVMHLVHLKPQTPTAQHFQQQHAQQRTQRCLLSPVMRRCSLKVQRKWGHLTHLQSQTVKVQQRKQSPAIRRCSLKVQRMQGRVRHLQRQTVKVQQRKQSQAIRRCSVEVQRMQGHLRHLQRRTVKVQQRKQSQVIRRCSLVAQSAQSQVMQPQPLTVEVQQRKQLQAISRWSLQAQSTRSQLLHLQPLNPRTQQSTQSQIIGTCSSKLQRQHLSTQLQAIRAAQMS